MTRRPPITVAELMARAGVAPPVRVEPPRAAGQTRFGNTERGMPWTPGPARDYLRAALPAPKPEPDRVRSIDDVQRVAP